MIFLFAPQLGFLNLGPTEVIIILIIAVILFGGRLPDVARNIGKVFFELKKNVRDIQSDIYQADFTTSTPSHRHEVSAPKNLSEPYYSHEEEDAAEEQEASPSDEEDAAAKKEEKGDQGETKAKE